MNGVKFYVKFTNYMQRDFLNLATFAYMFPLIQSVIIGDRNKCFYIKNK